ncbi:S9 family peptidase [Reinekea sp. G2M2-21]|uniref:alpha/beta hydrolase family protein n=1 Tax=Reinekea sp. G2M2-21 TaxID=2788942 RepID=UPI0018ABA9FE|nr:alpha/beta hydrolase [Reinekea sp. G2M2-21]
MFLKPNLFILCSITLLCYSLCFAEPVVIPSGDLSLDGELTRPSGDITGTLIFVGGSGTADIRKYAEGFRETLLMDVFLPKGYAVLSMNKRGIGHSEGNWQRSSIETRADDLQAAIQFVRQQDELKAKPIAIAGHSQGGWVVQEVASREPDLQFAIDFAGPVVAVAEQDLQLIRLQAACQGADVKQQERAVIKRDKAHRRMQFFGQFVTLFQLRFMANILPYNPATALQKNRVPMLLAFAENDLMADASQNTERLQTLFPEGIPDNLTIHIEPQTDHMFRLTSDRCVTYTQHDQRPYSPAFVAYLDDWVALQLAP